MDKIEWKIYKGVDYYVIPPSHITDIYPNVVFRGMFTGEEYKLITFTGLSGEQEAKDFIDRHQNP